MIDTSGGSLQQPLIREPIRLSSEVTHVFATGKIKNLMEALGVEPSYPEVTLIYAT